MATLPMMTQPELVDALANRTGWAKADVRRILMELESVVVQNVKQCVRTKVAGVIVEPKLRAKRSARMGRNPQTGEAVKIAAKPASVRVAAKVTKPIKDAAPSTRKLQSSL